MQIWKSVNIFVFIWKWYCMSKISHLNAFYILRYVHVRCFVYKHSETIEYVKNDPTL